MKRRRTLRHILVYGRSQHAAWPMLSLFYFYVSVYACGGPWWEGVIWVGGEIWNLVPWGGISPYCVDRRE